MPALGHTMEVGTVREWLVSVGAQVRRGDVLAVVESDKVSIEIEAPGDGDVVEIAVPAGMEVPVGTVLARIGSPGMQMVSEPRRAASDCGVPASESSEADAGEPTRVALDKRRASKASRLLITPLARRIARQHGLDPNALMGHGPRRRIYKADVLAALNAPDLKADRTQPSAMDPVGIGAPLSHRRRIIGERMARAWKDQPMVTLHRGADVTDLMDWRRSQPSPPRITTLLVAAFARALARHAQLNGMIDGDRVVSRGAVNLAVAVALDDGVVAPVVRDAHRLSVDALGRAIDRLVMDARRGDLTSAQLADGTATLSNLGTMEVESFTPILTPGQIVTLGVGAVTRVLEERPGGFAFRSRISLSLTFDHRAADGADGARLLQELARYLADPQGLVGARGMDEQR